MTVCNGLFIDIPAYQIEKLQRVQNTAGRIVTGASYDQPSTEILKHLHWLPVRARIMFKVLVTIFRVVIGKAPIYLKYLFKPVDGNYRTRLRSSSSSILQFVIPRKRTKIAERSINVTGAKWWNALPNDIKTLESEESFKKQLKTHLFKQFYE